MRARFAVVVAAFASSSAAAQYASCTFLNTLDGEPVQCRAHCISADGKVVAGVLGIPSQSYEKEVLPVLPVFQAFTWTETTGIVPLGGFEDAPVQTEAFGISGDGSVVVGCGTSANGTEAFRWTERTGFVGLGDLEGGPFSSDAHAVSRDGLIVVGTGWRINNNYPFRWSANGGMIEIDDASGAHPGGARATGADGSIIAGSCKFDPNDGYEIHAFRWTEESGLSNLGHIPGGKPTSRTRAMTPDGRVIVGHSDSAANFVATRWTEETGMVSLGQLDAGQPAIALGVSDDGNMIVGSSSIWPEGSHAILWTPETGMVDLKAYLIARGVKNLTYRALMRAEGISADGTIIVGTAKYLSANGKSQVGPEEAFIVHLGAAACYPDCDGTGELDIDDFICFQTLFATSDLGADCDASGELDIDDFICFQTAFGGGCG